MYNSFFRILPDTNMPAAGIYYGPPADGKQPARFLICCDNLHDRPKYGATALALHEAEPGHHFQVVISAISLIINCQSQTDMGMERGDVIGERFYAFFLSK